MGPNMMKQVLVLDCEYVVAVAEEISMEHDGNNEWM
jgi:hypothetical protein